jgi:N-acetylglucosaminyl-diphospho-decaprenol L-rhamnosyltransferase
VGRLLPGAPIFVVDNGSTDQTLEIARSFPHVEVLVGHGNIGYGAAVNRGVSASRGRVVLVINPDIVVTTVDVAALDELIKSEPFGLVGCASADPGERQPPIMAAWGWFRELALALWIWFLKPRGFSLVRPVAKPGAPAWIGGAALMFSSAEWEVIGGFDEAIFLYYEDVDLSRRYQARGLPLRTSEAVKVEHHREAERGTELELIQSWALRSLVQTTGTWQGAEAAERAAILTLAALATMEGIFRIARWLPWVGPRSARKARAARRVRALLIESQPQGIAPSYYGVANVAYGRAARRLAMSADR